MNMSIKTTSKDTTETMKIDQSETVVTHIAPLVKTVSLRKRSSLKPRKSLLKVKSLRPTKAVLGKIL